MTETDPSAGQKLRERIGAALDLATADPVWAAVLDQACEAADDVAALAALVASEGRTTHGSAGQTVIHPAVAGLRHQRAALTKLLLQLGVSDEQLSQSERQRRARQGRRP